MTVVLLSGVLPLVGSLAAHAFFGDEPRVWESLHEAVELAGSGIALGVSILLWLRFQHEHASTHLVWVVAALVAMGIVDAVHGVHGITDRSWLRHGGTLTGGMLFGLVWLPLPSAIVQRRRSFILIVAGLALAEALLLWWGSVWLPRPWNPAGFYTPPVVIVNVLGGLGFLAAALFFLRRYVREPRTEELVFANHTLLFGGASLFFGFSHTWAADWWVNHGVRLLAYVVLLIAADDIVVTLTAQMAQYAQDLEARVHARAADLAAANAKLRETNEYLAKLFNCANAPIIVWDTQFRIARLNRAVELLTGRTAEEVVGGSLDILIPPAQAGSAMERIRQADGSRWWETVELPILHLSGSVRTVTWTVATILAPDGTTQVATIAHGHDITERKEAEARISEQLQELRRWQEATLGRERRVLEVKREVNTLLAELGQPPRYPSVLEGGGL